jgi:predicted DNA-binding protein
MKRQNNYRLTLPDKLEVDAHARHLGIDRSALMRNIIQQCLGNPEEVTAAFIRRMNRVAAHMERAPAEEKVQIALTLSPELNEGLKIMSSQTGMPVEGIVSLMISSYMMKVRADLEDRVRQKYPPPDAL